MNQFITEKIDVVSEGIMDSMFNLEKSAAGQAMKKYRERFIDPQQGYVDNLPLLATQAGMSAYDKALERGAGEGGAMGLAGGAGLGFGLSGRGTVSSVARGAKQGADLGQTNIGKTFKSGKGALAALIANLALKTAGTGLGAGSGLLAGFAGGRQTGASIMGAGAGAAAGGVIGQPLAALLALAGGAGAAQVASSVEDARKKLSPGGPDQVIFRG